MTPTTPSQPSLAASHKGREPLRFLNRSTFPFVATVLVFVLLYTAAAVHYTGFSRPQVFLNLLADNAFVGVAAVGLTFVILTGGIDLSVGSAVGCGSIIIATLVEKQHLHPYVAILLVLAMGTGVGGGMGALIRYFDLPPFLVTLAGLFLYRGIGLLVSTESVSIMHPLFSKLSMAGVPLGDAGSLQLSAIVFLLVVAVGIYLSRHTTFGRVTYAIGGSEQSALLMGLPVGRTKMGVYALSGFCSALASVVYAVYTSSGNANAGTGLELDAIAAVVVGGTLLSGGTGYVAGTLVGVLIFGVIQTAITFQGTLSSWWTKIAAGTLLLLFILLQRAMHRRAR